MAHFAKINSNNIVTNVIRVADEDLLDAEGNESEQVGKDFLYSLFGEHGWVQTSINASIRKNYAGVGYKYDSAKNAFIPPKPDYESWTLNETTCKWEAPVSYPDDGNLYNWNEDNQQWVYVRGSLTNE